MAREMRGRSWIDHAAAADVGVADLAVAHLTGGQAHVQTGGGELRMRVLAVQTVKHRRVRAAHGVALDLIGSGRSRP